MSVLHESTTAESPSQVLRRLDTALTWLWSVEPECSLDERQELLARLNMVSSRIDRLVLHHDADPHADIDAAELIVCSTELDALGRRWPAPSEFGSARSSRAPMEMAS